MKLSLDRSSRSELDRGIPMRFPNLHCRLALSFAACTLAAAPSPAFAITLTWIPGSSVKVEQLIGDRDWATGAPTLSQTITRFDVEGTDLGSSFEADGRLIFLF